MFIIMIGNLRTKQISCRQFTRSQTRAKFFSRFYRFSAYSGTYLLYTYRPVYIEEYRFLENLNIISHITSVVGLVFMKAHILSILSLYEIWNKLFWKLNYLFQFKISLYLHLYIYLIS